MKLLTSLLSDYFIKEFELRPCQAQAKGLITKHKFFDNDHACLRLPSLSLPSLLKILEHRNGVKMESPALKMGDAPQSHSALFLGCAYDVSVISVSALFIMMKE